ncbi:hypothetical protein [Bacillus sp. RS11]|uniref:hypothetical protein n=1 Tax=Lysinibacillus sp. RS11 TaxID=3242682 RepID=UPI0035C685DC
MGFSELTVMALIYSGMMIFFLVPFKKQQSNFQSIFKESLLHITFHKKSFTGPPFINLFVNSYLVRL